MRPASTHVEVSRRSHAEAVIERKRPCPPQRGSGRQGMSLRFCAERETRRTLFYSRGWAEAPRARLPLARDAPLLLQLAGVAHHNYSYRAQPSPWARLRILRDDDRKHLFAVLFSTRFQPVTSVSNACDNSRAARRRGERAPPQRRLAGLPLRPVGAVPARHGGAAPSQNAV